MEMKRQAAVINMFYVRSLDLDQPQIANFAKADILNAMLTNRFVFVLNLYILPDVQKESFENFDDSNSVVFDQKWYQNRSAVGNIG